MTTTTFRRPGLDGFTSGHSGKRPGLASVAMWYARHRQRRQLAALDSGQLADIGVSREAALREARKPFWRA